MLLIVDAELVKDRVAVLGLRPGVLRLLEVEAAQEHESAIGRVLTVLEALAWVGCTVQAAAEHAVRREADLEPIGLDVHSRHLRAAVKEERVACLVRLHRVQMQVLRGCKVRQRRVVDDLDRRRDVQDLAALFGGLLESNSRN